MTTNKDSSYRICYVKGYGYGNYQIETLKPFFFFWKKWQGTHTCDTLSSAESIIAYLKSPRHHEYGEVLKEYHNGV